MSNLWVRDPDNNAAREHGTLWICLGETTKGRRGNTTYTMFKSVADGTVKGFDVSMGWIKPVEE